MHVRRHGCVFPSQWCRVQPHVKTHTETQHVCVLSYTHASTGAQINAPGEDEQRQLGSWPFTPRDEGCCGGSRVTTDSNCKKPSGNRFQRVKESLYQAPSTDTRTRTHTQTHTHTHAHTHTHTRREPRTENRARKAVKENSSGAAETSFGLLIEDGKVQSWTVDSV